MLAKNMVLYPALQVYAFCCVDEIIYFATHLTRSTNWIRLQMACSNRSSRCPLYFMELTKYVFENKVSDVL